MSEPGIDEMLTWLRGADHDEFRPAAQQLIRNAIHAILEQHRDEGNMFPLTPMSDAEEALETTKLTILTEAEAVQYKLDTIRAFMERCNQRVADEMRNRSDLHKVLFLGDVVESELAAMESEAKQ